MANIPDSAIGFLLQNLKDFLKYNYELLSGAEDNFEKLSNELGILKGFLQEFTKKYDNSILENLANSVGTLVRRAEDATETFMVETSKQKLRGRLKKLLHEGECRTQVLKLSQEIKDISAEVQELYKNKASLGIETMKLEMLIGEEGRPKRRRVCIILFFPSFPLCFLIQLGFLSLKLKSVNYKMEI